MKIGFDIDDVITETSRPLLEYVEKYGTGIDLNNPLTSRANILRGRFETKEAREFIRRYGIEISANEEIKNGAKIVITELKESGIPVHLITSRNEELIPGIHQLTVEYLKEKDIPYDQLHMDVYDKKQLCAELGINVLVDDSFTTCQSLEGTHTKPILFTTEINAEIDAGTIQRVANWRELSELIAELLREETKRTKGDER